MSVQLVLSLLGREAFGKIPQSELPRLLDALVAAVNGDPETKERLTRALREEIEKMGATNKSKTRSVPASAVRTFPGKRALVVDDDLGSRRLITRLLERQGISCDAAAGVMEARGLLEKTRYSLLVTDMRMWGEEGLDLVRFATDEYPEMAAIMVSGMDEAGLADKVVQAGASSYIQKPFTLEVFAENVAAAIEERAEMIKLRKHREG